MNARCLNTSSKSSEHLWKGSLILLRRAMNTTENASEHLYEHYLTVLGSLLNSFRKDCKQYWRGSRTILKNFPEKFWIVHLTLLGMLMKISGKASEHLGIGLSQCFLLVSYTLLKRSLNVAKHCWEDWRLVERSPLERSNISGKIVEYF